jgi:hydroxymethylpyrimidine kinase/phosphomethylpyrimidine kinase/thiamine-phosphate diphosphorylase
MADMTDKINITNNIKKKPIIWTISGSDCSGGAGIAADIKTGHALGVEVCHLITANTVQNSTQLISINPVPIKLLLQQVDALAEDKKPNVIKIGLIANIEQVHWLATILIKLKQKNSLLITVYDPVGQASVGGNFNTLLLTHLTPLLKQIDIITPNLTEAKMLAATVGSSYYLAKAIAQKFAINAVIVKGGHSEKNNTGVDVCIDVCVYQLNTIKQDNQEKTRQNVSYQLSSSRITSHYNHGGGCTFASAIAAFLAQEYLLRDAFTLSKAFINQGLAVSEQLSTLNGHQYYGAFQQLSWPNKAQYFPQINDDLILKNQNLPHFKSLTLKGDKLGLYPVIDSLYWLKRLLPLGLKIIQLRIKNLPQNELEQVIIDAIALAKNANTRLFINDYWQLAIKHGAYGVHIGQEDLANADLIQIQHAGLRLGISTHGCYEFLLAQQLQPSYLAIGAIFPTKTKDMTGQIQGIENLKQLLALRSKTSPIPIVAIGGINVERAHQVLATTVDSIAVVTAITEANNPEQAVLALTDLVKAY